MRALAEGVESVACRILVACGLALAFPGVAEAGDTWTTPFPGVRHLHRTGASNLEVNAAVIDLCSAGVSVRMTGFSERGKKTSAQAQAVGAQLAINTDFFCRTVDVAASGSPYPPCIGKPVYRTWGLAAHDGAEWPEEIHRDALAAFGPGRAQLYDLAEHHAVAPWMQEAFSGHFSLVIDGKISPDPRIQGGSRDPRTAVGLSKDHNTLILVVVDGRNSYRGVTQVELAQLLVELGADRGFNLDGGGSSTFWMQGKGVLNHPSDGTERTVGAHLAVYAKGTGEAAHCDRPWRVEPAAPFPPLQLAGAPVPLSVTGPAWLEDALRIPPTDGGAGLVLSAPASVSTSDGGVVSAEPADATAIALNVAATGGGRLGLSPCNAPASADAGLVLPDAGTFGSALLAPVGPGGLCLSPPEGVSLSAEQFGHLVPGAGLLLQPISPLVVLDTRADGGRFSGRIPEGRAVELPFAEIPGFPSHAEAAALEVHVEDSRGPGVLEVGPCAAEDGGRHAWSGWWESEQRHNTVIVPLKEGAVCLSAGGEPHATVKLTALFVPPPPPPVPVDAGTPGGVSPAGGGCGCTGTGGPSAWAGLALLALARRFRPQAHL